jgi:hypothetical protein
MMAVAGTVTPVMLQLRERMLLEEVMHPVRRGVEYEKPKCGGEYDARPAAAFERDYAQEISHDSYPRT